MRMSRMLWLPIIQTVIDGQVVNQVMTVTVTILLQ